MLYNPKWQKPSVAGFRAWLERQESEEMFCYADCKNCAVGQYLRSIGRDWFDLDFMPQTLGLNAFALAALRNQNSDYLTFGAVLEEIKKTAGDAT